MQSAINPVMTPREWAMLFALSLLWGGSFFFTAVALADVPPLTLVAARTGVACVALLIAMRVAGMRLPSGRTAWKAYAGMGILNNVVPFCLIVWAQTQIASGLASILNAVTPLMTVIVAHFLTADEKMTANRLAGVLLGLAGVTWMIGDGALGALGNNVLAQLAVLAAGLSYALSGIFGRRFGRMGVSPIAAATGQLLSSTVMLLPLVLLVDRPWTLSMPSAQGFGAIAGLALLSTALAYVVFFRILATAGATNLLLVTFLIPVSAILLGTLVLHEPIEGRYFVGMALIGAGLAAIDGRLPKRIFG
ncbi:MAG: DMT family transporter [Pseudorhodoplanes sp.]|nr:DMT family transporter [Pseudorhodoplanes sp.]